MKPTISFHRIAGLKLSPVKQHASSDGKPFWCRDLIVDGEDGTPFRLGLYTQGGPEAIIVDAGAEAMEVARAQIAAQMRAEDVEAARLAEKARVADPGYIPTLEEAMRNPAELVAGMVEEGPVLHTNLPSSLSWDGRMTHDDLAEIKSFGDTATCRTAVADSPPPAPAWKPEDYARCVQPDIGGRLKLGSVYQVAAVEPVVIEGRPNHPPLLDLRGVEGGPFLADRFEPIDVPF